MYVTPKSFLTFLDSYKTVYKQRLDNINTLASRMSNGLNKLIDAAAQVDVLRKELEINMEEIAVKNIQVEAVSVGIFAQDASRFLFLLKVFILSRDVFDRF